MSNEYDQNDEDIPGFQENVDLTNDSFKAVLIYGDAEDVGDAEDGLDVSWDASRAWDASRIITPVFVVHTLGNMIVDIHDGPDGTRPGTKPEPRKMT